MGEGSYPSAKKHSVYSTAPADWTKQTTDIIHEKTWTGLRKGNLKRETESLLIAAQNNAIKINYIKGRIDKNQWNSKCKLCGDRDENINHIISELQQTNTERV